MLSYLQEQHQLCVLGVGSDVERRLVELTERVHVSSVFDEGLGHTVVPMLCCPVQSSHLQHVFGVDVCTALKVHTVIFILVLKMAKSGACCTTVELKRFGQDLFSVRCRHEIRFLQKS